MGIKEFNDDFSSKRFDQKSIQEILEDYIQDIEKDGNKIEEIRFEFKNGILLRKCYKIDGEVVCF